MHKQLLATICLTILCLGPAPAALANQTDGAAWSVAAKVKRLVDSHTSYEFGNPMPPYQAPLSRLEWSLDSTWGGVEISRSAPKWSVSLSAMTNLSDEITGDMRDSDWEAGGYPKVRTTYSESNLRLEPSYDVRAAVDVSTAGWLGLPQGLDLRPVAGVRWQYFHFVAHDGTQWGLLPDGSTYALPMPGDVIRFKQTYWHYFVGLRLDWQPLPEANPGLRLKAQFDWAHVRGNNTDHHLMREGHRITEESTSGQAWHGLLGLEAPLGQSFFLELTAEYMTIKTTGSHRFYNDVEPYVIDETWDNGVEVWSKQFSATITLSYRF